MAKFVKEVTLGIDVSKTSLEVFSEGVEGVRIISNDQAAIEQFLDTFNGPVSIAVEATNIYHERLVELALAREFTVYLLDGYKLNKYRDAVGVRAKTDASDAHLIHRYLISERAHLRALHSHSPVERQLWRLIKRRAKLVKMKSQLKMSLDDLGLQVAEKDEAIVSIGRLICRLTALAQKLARELGWRESINRLRTIPGVGELNALALKVMYSRGDFTNVDRFIAFLGLDIKVRDSGTYKGRRKLTKKGDPEVRRLLFNGARNAAIRHTQWREHKQQLMARGISEIQTSVIQARKIARIAYALMKTGGVYELRENTCITS